MGQKATVLNAHSVILSELLQGHIIYYVPCVGDKLDIAGLCFEGDDFERNFIQI